MKQIDFYGGKYKITNKLAKVELRKSEYGGVDIFVDGQELPWVVDVNINVKHPFPRVTVQIAMESLSLDDGILQILYAQKLSRKPQKAKRIRFSSIAWYLFYVFFGALCANILIDLLEWLLLTQF